MPPHPETGNAAAVQFQADMARLPDGGKLSAVYLDRATSPFGILQGSLLLANAGEGIVADPSTDLAATVQVTKTGFTNDDLGNNVVSVQVPKG